MIFDKDYYRALFFGLVQGRHYQTPQEENLDGDSGDRSADETWRQRMIFLQSSLRHSGRRPLRLYVFDNHSSAHSCGVLGKISWVGRL